MNAETYVMEIMLFLSGVCLGFVLATNLIAHGIL